MDDHEIKSERYEQRLLSLERTNFALERRVQSLERENERLTSTLEKYKMTEHSHTASITVEQVKEELQRDSVVENFSIHSEVLTIV